MSDSPVQVDIELLRRHPSLPEASDVLARFAEHHAQSEARRRSHDELMQSDSNLDLEDFGALAASALGSNDSHDSILDEEAPSFADNEQATNDTLPEQEAAPESPDEATAEPDFDEATPDAEEDASDQPQEDNDHPAASVSEDDVGEDVGEEGNADAEPEAQVTASEESTTSKESSPKKRTRKRKKKKKS